MNSLAHRTIKAARDELVEGFQLFAVYPKGTSVNDMADQAPGQLTVSQFQELCEITQRLRALMTDDPYPPECQVCGEPLPALSTAHFAGWGSPLGRPRKFCSNKCRQADYRERHAQEGPDLLPSRPTLLPPGPPAPLPCGRTGARLAPGGSHRSQRHLRAQFSHPHS